jgi:3-methylcrotonyl-CoA carboxylase alpha subunit
MFSTLLIANRGEIACRIMRTARRMGIRCIAVFSDADADAQHVKQADAAVRIGPAPPRESYLDISAILAAARRSGAEAIHPGYGFLSENSAFAEACVAAGIIFVGPSAAAMRAMGSKSAAKSLMEESNVPLLAGYHGDDQDSSRLSAHAARVGFPVVIKAVAGGGGRGMRVVRAAGEFSAALDAARQEAASAFGDDRVLIERYLERPRHIEVQIFGDTHGNFLHLFERDCSAQRRHQKIIEEAPAPGIDSSRRAALGQAAIAAARAVKYVGAGTVEFIADGTEFYFLEMNTRLQVEHPVTECITGFDLVEWQLRVAAGEPLPVTQAAINITGHAMEARIYAEDPARDFSPSAGVLSVFRMPGDGVRVDAGVVQGDTVGTHYDAMLAKLIVHAPTRHEALRQLQRALAASEIAGVAHNLDLLARVAAHPDFVAGGIDTGFIERHADTLLAPQRAPDSVVMALAALGVMAVEAAQAALAAAESADAFSPWNAMDFWWPNATPARHFVFEAAEEKYEISVAPEGDGWRLACGDSTHRTGTATCHDGQLGVVLDGLRHVAGISHVGENVTLRVAGETWRFGLPDPIARAEEEDDAGGRLIAPLPGQVTQVLAQAGRKVARGEVLVVLEAMKTVFRLTAPADGTIETVACRAGEMVQEGQLLVAFLDDQAAS